MNPDLLKEHWFSELGCEADSIADGTVVVSSHGPSLQGYSGIIAFKYRQACILSTPSDRVDSTREKVGRISADALFNVETLSQIFGSSVERIIGPAWIGKISAVRFSPCHTSDTRLLAPSDWTNFNRFLERSDKVEVEHSALVSGRNPTVGVFINSELVAAAGFEILEEKVAHIGVLSNPTFRGRGFGSQAISLITRIALDRKLGIQYQTLINNIPSIHAAQKLGYEKFSETIAVRLR